MAKILLHTAGIFFETGLGLWIFAKIFPRRSSFRNRHLLGEAVMYTLMLLIFYLNFAEAMPIAAKIACYFIWITGLLLYRCYFERRGRLQRKYLRVINGVLAALSFLAMASILAWNSWLGYISVGMVMVGNIFVPYFMYRYYECSLVQAYLYEILFSAIISLVKCTYMVYIGGIASSVTVYEVNRIGWMHNYSAILFSMATCIATLILVKYFSVWEFLRRVFQQYKVRLFIIDVGGVMLLHLFSYLGEDGLDANDVTIVFAVAIIAIIGLLALVIRTFANSIEGEKRLLDVRNNAIEQQYRELRKAYEQNRCLIHDEKHMLQYIEECLENGDVQKAREFTGKCRVNIAGKSKHPWTGIPTLDFIINMKKRKMDELSVEFHLNAQVDNLPMDDADFVVLLGNLFDNAIEATEKCGLDKREILLSIRNVNEMFLLQMQNTSDAAPVKKKERFITSKKETESHGWGIESIRHIVDKYGGDISFAYDDTMFQVRIMIDME